MSYTAFLTAAISLMMTLAVAQPVPVPAEAETAKVNVSLDPINVAKQHMDQKLTGFDSVSLSARH